MHVLQGPWHYDANNDDEGKKELRSRLIGEKNVNTITTILLEKHEACTLGHQQIQQQQQETEKERLKRAAREFKALLESFVCAALGRRHGEGVQGAAEEAQQAAPGATNRRNSRSGAT